MQLTKSKTIGGHSLVFKEPTVPIMRGLLAAFEPGGDLEGFSLLTLFGEHWAAITRRGGELVVFPHGVDFDSFSESELREIWEEIKSLSPFLSQMEAMWMAVIHVAGQRGKS